MHDLAKIGAADVIWCGLFPLHVTTQAVDDLDKYCLVDQLVHVFRGVGICVLQNFRELVIHAFNQCEHTAVHTEWRLEQTFVLFENVVAEAKEGRRLVGHAFIYMFLQQVEELVNVDQASTEELKKFDSV